jgi:CRISPR-associated protein Cst2
MAPASIVIRLTESLVAGYETYGFKKAAKGDEYIFPEVIDGILHEPQPDYPGSEFYIGGRIVKDMNEKSAARLTQLGVTLDRDPRRLLETVANKAFPAKGAK